MGYITAVQRFSVHDGPGIRTTVFLKGCSLRCFWCHNPETQNPLPELAFWQDKCLSCGACTAHCPHAENGTRAAFTSACTVCGACAKACFTHALTVEGEEVSAKELFSRIVIDREAFSLSGGGVTFSGGEPFLQNVFLRELLVMCRENGIHTAVESALSVPYENIASCLPYIDLLYCDIKTVDPQKHQEGCGADNHKILENIRTLCRTDTPLLFRTPIIPDFNDDENSVRDILRFLRQVNAPAPPQLLEFHNYCSNKYRALGRVFAAGHLQADRDRFAVLQTLVEKEWDRL